MTCILGIDVGGTFTDFVYYDPSEDKFSEIQKSDILSDLEEGYVSKADAIRLYSLDDND